MGTVVRSEEETKYLLRREIGELLHELAKRRPDLRGWAVEVQECVFDALEGGRGGCAELEHIGDETKHAVWLVVESLRRGAERSGNWTRGRSRDA